VLHPSPPLAAFIMPVALGNCAVPVSLRAGPESGSHDLEIALLVLTPPKEEGES
jgi:hypothetical protein